MGRLQYPALNAASQSAKRKIDYGCKNLNCTVAYFRILDSIPIETKPFLVRGKLTQR
jgi:hypothetical protein